MQVAAPLPVGQTSRSITPTGSYQTVLSDQFSYLPSCSESSSLIEVTASQSEKADSICCENIADPDVSAWPMDMPDTNTILPNDVRTNIQRQLLPWLVNAFKASKPYVYLCSCVIVWQICQMKYCKRLWLSVVSTFATFHV